ncbi:hypothetical protein CR513_48303, partial [Mucuna pruriens]
MFYSFVREMWENLIETYSMKNDFTACYDIERKIFNSRQGILSITYEKTRQLVMLDKGNSNTGSAMVIGKGSIKRSTSEENPSQRVVVANIVRIANDQDIARIPATSVMERRKFLNEWVEIKAQLKFEHPSTLQLDQDIQAFSKEEMDRL